MPAHVIIPKNMIDPGKMARAVANALDGAARGALVDFKVTTQTWNHQPGFTIETPSPDERIVGTNSEIYNWVNNGTGAHTILPRRKRLRFPSKFRPKSRPGAIRSNKGMRGGPIVYARAVRHPGIAARKFDEAIAKKWQQQLPIIMQRAIDAEVQ